MDNLTYNYSRDGSGNLLNNKLLKVKDDVTDPNYTEDLKTQGDNNYLYDKIGNLITDVQAGISNIEWTVYGKIKRITKSGSSLEYRYDASGNRVYKGYTHDGITDKTWYVRDAQGNTLAIYGNKSGGTDLYWKEQHLYGSSRLGIWEPDLLTNTESQTAWGAVGKKRYELTNHLGNVLATITDKSISVSGHYEADLLSAQDYYPFGMQQPDRSYTLGTYRYGFNGKENDNEVKGVGNQQDYGMRVYDPRLGKFLSVDPLTPKYPELTPYQFASNRPIDGIDIDGKEWGQATDVQYIMGKGFVLTTTNVLRVKVINASTIITSPDIIRAKVEFFKQSVEGMYTNFHSPQLIPDELIITEVILDFTPAAEEESNASTLTFVDKERVYTNWTDNGGHHFSWTFTGGQTSGQINKFTMEISLTDDCSMVSNYRLRKTFQHEVGHSAGLNHPWELSMNEMIFIPELNQQAKIPNKPIIFNNLLNSGENPNDDYLNNYGHELLPSQLDYVNKMIKDKSIWKNINELRDPAPIGTNNDYNIQ